MKRMKENRIAIAHHSREYSIQVIRGGDVMLFVSNPRLYFRSSIVYCNEEQVSKLCKIIV